MAGLTLITSLGKGGAAQNTSTHFSSRLRRTFSNSVFVNYCRISKPRRQSAAKLNFPPTLIASRSLRHSKGRLREDWWALIEMTGSPPGQVRFQKNQVLPRWHSSMKLAKIL